MISREEYAKAKSIVEDYEQFSLERITAALQETLNDVWMFDRQIKLHRVYICGDEGSFNVFLGKPVVLHNECEVRLIVSPDVETK